MKTILLVIIVLCLTALLCGCCDPCPWDVINTQFAYDHVAGSDPPPRIMGPTR